MTFKFLSNLETFWGSPISWKPPFHSSGAGPQPCPRVKPSWSLAHLSAHSPPPPSEVETGSPRPFPAHVSCPSAAPQPGASPEDAADSSPPFAPPTLSWARKPADLGPRPPPNRIRPARIRRHLSALLSEQTDSSSDSWPSAQSQHSPGRPSPASLDRTTPARTHAMLTLQSPRVLEFSARGAPKKCPY